MQCGSSFCHQLEDGNSFWSVSVEDRERGRDVETLSLLLSPSAETDHQMQAPSAQ